MGKLRLEGLLRHRYSLETALRDLKSGAVRTLGRRSQMASVQIGAIRLDTTEQRIATIEKRIAQIDDQIERGDYV